MLCPLLNTGVPFALMQSTGSSLDFKDEHNIMCSSGNDTAPLNGIPCIWITYHIWRNQSYTSDRRNHLDEECISYFMQGSKVEVDSN